MPDKYRLIGPAYDWLSKTYSGDAIYQCKISMLRRDTIASGSKVLFAGAGQGQDAIFAAELDADVTVVDISPTMLKQLNDKLVRHPERDRLKLEPVLGDIMKFEDFLGFDVVVVNFFLNVFEREKMSLLLQHLSKHCKPDGTIVIGDFKPGSGSLWKQSAHNLYWYAAASAFFLAAGNAIHRIYDYAPMLEKLGFVVEEQQEFKVMGLPLYYSLRATRQ